MDCFHNGHEIRSILFPTLSFDTLTNYHLRLPSSTTIMFNFNVKNRRSLRRAGLMTAIAAPSLMSGLVRSQGTSGRAQLRITLTTSNRGYTVPRWVTRPVFPCNDFAHDGRYKNCSVLLLSFFDGSSGSLARLYTCINFRAGSSKASSDERLLLAIQKPTTEASVGEVCVGSSFAPALVTDMSHLPASACRNCLPR